MSARANPIIEGDALHASMLWPIVIDRFVLRDPIIPKRNAVWLPTESTTVFR